MTELLIGCGHRRDRWVWDAAQQCVRDGQWMDLVTLDRTYEVDPDVVADLGVQPLPFRSDVFDEVHAYEVLEHLGAQGDWRFFFDQFADFWRILRPGGL